jgi:hypothetical protein
MGEKYVGDMYSFVLQIYSVRGNLYNLITAWNDSCTQWVNLLGLFSAFDI